jgi:hypothetical protein
MNKFINNISWERVIDIVLIAAICFLSYNDKDGWGWLILLLILKN